MKKKTLSIVLALTVAMGIALTGCGKNAETENADKSKETTVTTTTDEKSSETEQGSTDGTDESTETETEEDYTYCNLLSDPYFDMDNAIKDEKGTAGIQSVIPSAADKELLYNIIDGDKYVEITGAESYDANKTIVKEGSVGLYPNLAYYGVDPNPSASGGPVNEFQCMGDTLPYWDTNYGNYGFYLSNEEITILKAYTIPTVEAAGIAGGIPVVSYGDYDGTPALCEVEYNGTHYWTTSIALEYALGQWE